MSNSIEKAINRLGSKEDTSSESVENGTFNAVRIGLPDNNARVDSSSLNINHIDIEEYLNQHIEEKRIAEEYRLIKRGILKNAFSNSPISIKNGRLVMVTSSLPGEGKTFTALNLAMSIAIEKDVSVLLVDCDDVNPTLSKTLGVQECPGLINLLDETELDISNVIIQTDISNFRILPAGKTHKRSTELLSSRKMSEFMEDISKRYSDRIIIFDSPPILAASQAVALSQIVGQIVMVVEAESTPPEALHEALSLLDQEKAIGLVLNKSRIKHIANYYGSYY